MKRHSNLSCRVNDNGSVFNVTTTEDFHIQVYDGDDQYFINRGTFNIHVTIGITIYIYARFENRGSVYIVSGGTMRIRASGSEHTGSWTYQVILLKYKMTSLISFSLEL
jgi:hypothetical protein